MLNNLSRLWKQIARRRKKQLGLIFVLMIISSFAEVISIGAVIPFIGVLANPEAVFDHELAQPTIEFLGLSEPRDLLLPLTLAFISAAILASIMRIFLLVGQTKLSQAIGADLGYRIFHLTLFQPYSTHVSRNSSEVISSIASKADQVVGNIIAPAITICSSSVLTLTVLIALVGLNPAITLGVSAGFFCIYGLISIITKRKLNNLSKLVSDNTDRIYKVLQEGLGAIREILIDGSQSIYCNSFSEADLPRRRSIANVKILASSPRFFVETLGIIILAWIAYILGTNDDGLVKTLPLLGALAIGAQRILPNLQQGYASISHIQGAKHILTDTLKLLEQPAPKALENIEKSTIKFHKSIHLRHINFCYTNDGPTVISNLNLEIHAGSIIGILGKTGSGKSTLLDIIMALLFPTSGTLSVDGNEISQENCAAWHERIAHIPQTLFLADSTIAENIAFGIPMHEIDMKLVEQVAQQAEIHQDILNLSLKYETIVGERGVRLSGGQRQRIGIARALYKRADVLILDEATSALDNSTEKSVMESIQKFNSNATIIMVAHRVTTLENCDIIYELDRGSIIREGSPDVMLT